MQLLKLRIFQAKRDLSYWVVIIAVIAFYIAKSVDEFSDLHGLAMTGLIIISIYNYHQNRKDQQFLRHYFNKPALQVGINYNLLILPVSLALIISNTWYLALLLHIAVSMTGMISLKTKHFKLLWISKYIPPQHFEWIAGLRKSFFSLFVLYLLALVLCPVKLFGLVALLVFNSVFLGFYSQSEPLIMLNPRHLDAKEFLSEKVAFLTKIILFTNLPLLIVNSIFNMDALGFTIGFLPAFILLGASSIYIKYANYSPNQTSRMSIGLLLLTASLFFPYLIPLSILIYFSNRKKALTNLSHYLT